MTVALVIALSVTCMALFATACDGNDDKNYSVTVVYADGTAVNGTTDGTGGMDGKTVQIQVCQKDDPTKCYQLVSVDANGKVTIEAEKIEAVLGTVTYAVHVQGLPTGYTYDDNYTLSQSSRSITITLKAV
ncbi:MAG: hypothetical protein HDP34_04110 [Clostridia bacterium]|nr:hypothetical protein [Clostridia bacterium]